MDNGATNYARFLSGDEDGMIEIIKEYKDGMIFYINSIIHNLDDAEDIVEDTFVNLVVKKPRFLNKSKFKTWLYRIAHNMTCDYLKRESKYKKVSIDSMECVTSKVDYSTVEEFEKKYLKEEQRIEIYKALSEINLEYQQVIFLVFFEEFSNAQVAKIMNKNRRQIENILYRAKLSLKKELLNGGFMYENL